MMDNRQPTDKEIKVVNYEINEYTRAIQMLAPMLMNSFDCVIGVSRGGLPAAVHLSNVLNIPMLMVSKPRFSIDRSLSNMRVLIIDDILDTGETLSKVIGQLPLMASSISLWCPFYKQQGIDRLTDCHNKTIFIKYQSTEVFEDTWIRFWWEGL